MLSSSEFAKQHRKLESKFNRVKRYIAELNLEPVAGGALYETLDAQLLIQVKALHDGPPIAKQTTEQTY